MRPSYIIISIILAVLLLSVAGERMSGTKHGITQDGFVYLGKFAFDANPQPVSKGRLPVGTIDIDLTFLDKEDFGKQFRVIDFTDNDRDWPAIAKKSVKCTDKIERAKSNVQSFLKVNPETGVAESITLKPQGGTRRRFHYLALVYCGGFGKFEYKLHYQRLSAGKWTREFGVNEVGLNTLFVVFFIIYFFFLGATCYNSYTMSKTLAYVHPIVKLVGTIVGIFFVALVFHLIHYGSFTTDGKGVPALETIADCLDIIARTAFILLLLLLAKGWAITSTNLRNRNMVALCTISFGLIHLIAFLVHRYGSNPADVDLNAGIIFFYNVVVALGFVFAGWFGWIAFNSYRTENNPVKSAFLLRLGIVFFLYLLFVPTIAFLSYLVDPWVRDHIITTFNLTTTTAGLMAMVGLLWHTHSTKYFEFENPSELVVVEDNFDHL